MTYIPYLFNQTTEQMRRIGARGGKTQARNRRARQRAAGAAPRETPCRPRRGWRPPPKPWRSWMRNLPGYAVPRSPSARGGSGCPTQPTASLAQWTLCAAPSVPADQRHPHPYGAAATLGATTLPDFRS